MLTLQFIDQNLHFAVSLFAALVFFAAFWLYFDAWIDTANRSKRDILKWLGFLFVAIAFVPNATLVEQADLGRSIFGDTAIFAANVLRVVGYIIIIVSQLADPLQPKPKTTGLAEEFSEPDSPAESDPTPPGDPAPTLASAVTANPPAEITPRVTQIKVGGLLIGAGIGKGLLALCALPAGALAVAILYWRRATMGLERHLRPVAIAFAFIFGFELLSLAELFRNTTNPALFDLVKAFGPFWVASHLFLLIGVVALGRWVWHYLTERFMSQLFMTFIGVVLGVFLVTTISFTFLLLENIQNNALSNLATATSVLNYALDSKKSATQANAEAVAANPAVGQAITAKDHTSLVTLTSKFLASKQESSLVITNADGEVLMRAEDPDRWGDSISSDTLFRRAAIGNTSSTVESQSAVLAPVISIRSVAPVRDSSGTIVGSVSISTVINNAFLDGIKRSTGLDAAIYSNDIRSATTFTAPDGTSRWIGVKETNNAVTSAVLQRGQTYKGQLSVLNRQYLAVYAPLRDADDAVIGMLFIGQPEVTVLQTTSYLIGVTFIVAACLLVASIIPAYIVARYITKQLE